MEYFVRAKLKPFLISENKNHERTENLVGRYMGASHYIPVGGEYKCESKEMAEALVLDLNATAVRCVLTVEEREDEVKAKEPNKKSTQTETFSQKVGFTPQKES